MPGLPLSFLSCRGILLDHPSPNSLLDTNVRIATPGEQLEAVFSVLDKDTVYDYAPLLLTDNFGEKKLCYLRAILFTSGR